MHGLSTLYANCLDISLIHFCRKCYNISDPQSAVFCNLTPRTEVNQWSQKPSRSFEGACLRLDE